MAKKTETVIVQPSAEEQKALALATDKYGAEIVAEWSANGYKASDVEFLEMSIPALQGGQRLFVGTLVQMGQVLEEIVKRSPHGQIAYVLNRAGVSPDVALTARHIYKAVAAYPQLGEMAQQGLLPATAVGRLAQSKAFKTNADELIGAVADAVAGGQPLTLGDTRAIIEAMDPTEKATSAAKIEVSIDPADARTMLERIVKPAAKMLKSDNANARMITRRTAGYKAFMRSLGGVARPGEDPALALIQDLTVALYACWVGMGQETAEPDMDEEES